VGGSPRRGDTCYVSLKCVCVCVCVCVDSQYSQQYACSHAMSHTSSVELQERWGIDCRGSVFLEDNMPVGGSGGVVCSV